MNRRKFTKTTIGAIAGVATLGSIAYGKDLKSKQRKTMKIVLGADSFAYSLKKAVAEHLKKRNIEVIDTDNYANTPYYEVAEKSAKIVANGDADGAVLFCGTGAGMCIVANKVKGINAVAVESVFSAGKAKAINNANVITMGAMIVGDFMACAMVDAWFDTKFAQGFEPLKDFLDGAYKSVSEIDARNRK
ncbi:MAG: RpiB/LacA/LacB family sugar-phosphate isomerase [Opitutales bacterium]|nr:RpiB/LacA/LacB family sugar-phosphate isomerase [Opitutales bacterium]